VRYEQKLTPFEVGPAAWLCEFSRLPVRIVQTPSPKTNEKAKENVQLVVGRTVWIRDRFGFPPDEVSDMEHKIQLVISEQSILRATTHHSDGVDVFLALTREGETQRACAAVKHPGPVPRQTIFCRLDPGTYTLTFFADYPLGGLHPCSDFFAQIAVRPTALADTAETKKCISATSDLSRLKVQRSLELATTPQWKTMRVPIKFSKTSSIRQIWSQSVEILEEEERQNLYLRLVVHSDYVSSDLRFQVKYEGKYIADTQVTSHGYADMIGPLDAGTYTLAMYYVIGIGPTDTQLCSTSMVDLRVVSRSQYVNQTAQWLCTSTRVPPPDVLAPQPDEQILLDSEYVVPSSGIHTVRLQVSETRLIRIQAESKDADFKIQIRTWPALTVVESGQNNLEVVVGRGSFALRIKALMKTMGSGASCSTMRLNLLLQPMNSLPQCPWLGASADYSPAANSAQVEADDHIGSVLLDLVPQHLTQDTQPKPPVTLWMSQGMEKSFEMIVDSTAAMRLEVVVQPPFLPLDVAVRRKRPSGKIEPPLASAEWTESRLLLMYEDLPRGKYLVEFKMPRKYTVHEDAESEGGALQALCAHVTIFAEVGVASKEAINSMRAELLDLPDLLAVQPFPPNFNMVGWFSSPLTPMLGTQVYNFPDGPGKATLKVEDKAILRLVCEPADLSNAEATLSLYKDGKLQAEADTLGQLVAEVDAGTFEVQLAPKEKAPFLVTAGVATMSRLREDIMLQDSSRPCSDKMPALHRGVNFSPQGWAIGPTLIRLRSSWRTTDGVLSKVPVELTAPSILYIETGSSLPLDLIRIGMEVPEGLWVGEQRGMRNALQLELPPGKYQVQISQPKPAGVGIPRCVDFSVYIVATPLNPDAAADAAAQLAKEAGTSGASGEAGKRAELAPREQAAIERAPCFSMGTVPMPLDFSFPEGGSKKLGGPLGTDGRMLIRTRVLITDMHDGRKKIHLLTRRQKLTMKVGIIMGGFARLSLASQVSFQVQKIGASTVLDPVESWSQESGWERIYALDDSASGYWLSFHHPHRERSQSACLHFGLEMEIHPAEDTNRMFECSGESVDPEAVFPSDLEIDQSDDTTLEYRFKKPLSWIRQPPQGFLREMGFTLRVASYVFAELAHNYFLSHAEMDIVHIENHHESLVFGEPDFLHDTDNPLNSRQVVGRVLEPGDYKVRVADDHYPGQMASVDTACFPFAFEFRVVPEKAVPAVVSVQPHPSVPVPRGVDLVITIRFSEPPEGTLEEVVRKISLGGIQAVAGGSVDAMRSQYASRTATVQAEASEGNKLWVIGWSAEVLATLSEAKLTIAGIVSNATKRRYNFNPPTYKLVEAPKGIPWAGGSRASSPSSSDSSMPRPAGEAQSQDSSPAPQTASGSGSGEIGGVKMEGGGSPVSSSPSGQPASTGQAVPEGSGSSIGQSKPEVASTDTGMVHAETAIVHAESTATPAPPPPADFSSVHVESSFSAKEQEDYEPTVHQWVPTDRGGGSKAAPAPPPDEDGETKCPPGTVMNGLTGICDTKVLSSSVLSSMADSVGSLGESVWPSGYGSVITMCAGSVVLLAAIMNCGPQLKGMFGGARGSAASQSPASTRFKDIGERRPEEEMGLVSAAANDFDDDML